MDLVNACRRIRGIGPAGLIIEAGTGDTPHELLPSEVKATIGWAPQRRAQFALGRTIARKVLAKLGVCESAIPFDARGAPIWPSSVIGSISHKRQNCLVVAGHATQFDGLGVDLELDRVERNEDELVKRVCHTAAELRQCRELGNRCCSPATAFLSAKEAFFKLQYPIARMELGWDEVEVEFGSESTFAVMSRTSRLASHANGIAFMEPKGWIITLVLLRKPRNCS